MRVTHVITRLIVGGAQENTISSVLGLARKPDLQIGLISGLSTGPEGSLQSSFSSQPELLTILPSLVRQIHPLHDFVARRQLTKIFRRTQPDIVHTHSGKAGILGRLAAHRAKVPIIIHTIHGPSFGQFQNQFANTIFCAAEKRAAKVTTHFISVANAMTDQYLAAGIGRAEQYTRIFSGFALQPFLDAPNDLQLRAKLGIAPNDFVVGKIARLFKLKGHDDLFAAAPTLVREIPQIKFLLVGDGLWRERFENLARAMHLENHFVFTGLVPPTEVFRYVGLMDALVHLSRREGLPRALPQALAAARPVVAYDCDGAREVCQDGETGFLVSVGDQADLAQKLIRLARDHSLRVRLGRAGQKLVRENFSVQTMVDRIYELYLKLLQNGAAPRS